MSNKAEKDYIGFDPVVWVQRLLDVNDKSQFTDAQKRIINKNLSMLEDTLKNESS